MIPDEIEPVTTVGNVTRDLSNPGYINLHIFSFAPAGDIGDADLAVRLQRRLHNTHRRFEPMRAWCNSTQVRKRCDDADHPVPAHPEIAHIVEKDDARRICRVRRFQQKCTHHDIRTAWLVDDGRPIVIELRGESLQQLGRVTDTELGAT